MGLEDKADKDRPGQLRGGFNVIARDVDRALALARFDPGQVLLIEQARELSWTSAKIARSESPKPFRINVSALARVSGRERGYLSKQFKKLVEWGVFVAVDDAFLINKDFREWRDDHGHPRLSTSQVEWCLAVRRRRNDSAVVCSALHTPPVSSTTQGQTFSVSSTTHPCVAHYTPPVQCATHPHIEERAGGEFLESIREYIEEEPATVSTPVPVHEPAPSTPGRTPSELAIIRRAEALLASDLRTEPVAQRLMQSGTLPACLALPAWRFLRAAERLLSPDVDDAKRSWPYYFAIVRNLDESEREPITRLARSGRAESPQPMPVDVTGTFARKRPPAQVNGRHGGEKGPSS